MLDMAEAAKWLTAATKTPDPSMVESLSWLLAQARERERAHFRDFLAELEKPGAAVLGPEGRTVAGLIKVWLLNERDRAWKAEQEAARGD